MKKLFIYVALLLFAVACKPKATTDASGTPAAAAPSDMPYTPDRPWKNWGVGDPQNSATVMKMLKAWEKKDVAQALSYFADSTEMAFDNYRAKLSHDSMKPFLDRTLADYKTVSVKMDDWESVVSEDKKDAWVTVWYKQTWVDNKGVTDSLDVTDEARLKDGKIDAFVEYTMHYPKAKK
ncbi:MAG: hypothetical protein JWN78_202 [Bacteroidota bacterium]|nr:hypothetical protein [Bacteroidota bacterium]